jgi:hypothetical protein
MCKIRFDDAADRWRMVNFEYKLPKKKEKPF